MTPGRAFASKANRIIAIAKESGEIAVSIGCSRVRTGMSNNELTCAIPASHVSLLIEHLRAARAANNTVAAFAVEDTKLSTSMSSAEVLFGMGCISQNPPWQTFAKSV